MKKQITNNISYGTSENISEYLNLMKSSEIIYNAQDTNILSDRNLLFVYEDQIPSHRFPEGSHIIIITNRTIKNAINIDQMVILEILEELFGILQNKEYFCTFINNYFKSKSCVETITSLYWKYILSDCRDSFEKSVLYIYPNIDTILFLRKEKYKIAYLEKNKKDFLSLVLDRMERCFLKTGNKSLPFYYMCFQNKLKNIE